MRVEERGSMKLKGERVNESLAVPDLQGEIGRAHV